MSLAQNIDALFFAEHGELPDEFEHLFLALFQHPEPYIAVIRSLGQKRSGLTREEIIRTAHLTGNGTLTKVLKELAQCDFIRAYTPPGRKKRDLVYQLIDNYTLFYFRFLDGVTVLMPNFWSMSRTTPAVNVWCALAFERVGLQHLPSIKRKLGISGVITSVYSWRFSTEEPGQEGAQVDLVIDRKDQVINLCEMKYTAAPFEITADYNRVLQTRRETFIRETGTRSAVHLTLVSAHGLKPNANAQNIQSVITLDDLFE